MDDTANLERHRLTAERVDAENLEETINHRLRVNRELGFDRGVSVICSLLLQHRDLKLGQLAIDYVANLMATPLGEKLASMDYQQREEIIKLLNPSTGKERQ